MNNYLILALGALLVGISIFTFMKSKDDSKEKKRKSTSSQQRVPVGVTASNQSIESNKIQQTSRFEEEKQSDYNQQQSNQQQDPRSPGQRNPKSASLKSAGIKPIKEVKKPVYKSVEVNRLEGGIAGFEQDEIENLFDGVFPIQSVDPAQHPLFCIDSRNSNKGLGVPGGDGQIWLLGLRCLEIITKRELDLTQIQESFQNFLKQTKKSKFYMHTDSICMNDLKENLQMSQDQIDHFDIHKPPQEMKQIIIENVVKTKYQGCGYIMMMLTNPKAYQQRTSLIEGFIKVFYTELWNENNNKVVLEVLEGENSDQGYCIVQTDTQFQPELTNKTDKGSVCFHHVKAEGNFKQEVANYLAEYAPRAFSVEVSPQDLINKMNEIGKIQQEQSNKIFTEHVYKYNLTFKE